MSNNTNENTKSTYYDGTKLLSLMDVNGDKPEIYMCTSNRSAGKTTFFGKLCVNKFLKKGEKFGLLYRFDYELDGCADKFFKDIGPLFFPGYMMTSKIRARGKYHELYIDGPGFEEAVCCGYAISLNAADQLKRYSHLLSDVVRLLMDEFQSETNRYCDNEVSKFISIHTSLARGQGKQVRYLPVYMLSNNVSLINPYYTALNISSRLTNAKFFRGEGFVIEQGFVESAAKAQQESAFNRAFTDNPYVQYSSSNVYLNDNYAFIENVKGTPRYLATIKVGGSLYGIREYAELGIIHCSDKADISYPFRIAVSTEDHDINYVMLKRNDMFISNMRYFFERGCFRFKNLKCKEAIMTTLSY